MFFSLKQQETKSCFFSLNECDVRIYKHVKQKNKTDKTNKHNKTKMEISVTFRVPDYTYYQFFVYTWKPLSLKSGENSLAIKNFSNSGKLCEVSSKFEL